MTIMDRLFATLQVRGLTLEAFAKKIGVTAGAVSKWKTDLKAPPYKRMNKIAEVLGVSTRFLLTGQGEGVPLPESILTPTDATQNQGTTSAFLSPEAQKDREIERLRGYIECLEKEMKQNDGVWFERYQKFTYVANSLKRIVFDVGEHLKAVKDGSEPLEKFIGDFEEVVEHAKKDYNIDPHDPDQWTW